MIAYSITQKSQLEGAHRMDAEYYQPEYLENDKIIRNYKNSFKLLVELLKRKNAITGGATPLGAEYLKSGITFLRVQNVMQNYLELDDVVYISEDIHDGLLKRSKLKPWDVLLTITGVSYGKSAIVPEDFKEGNINQHSVKIEINDNFILPEFLSTFFNSKFGKYQNDRKITGLSRPGLVYTELKNILIPLVDLDKQIEIRNLVKTGNEILGQSNFLYSQAEDLLLKELGLKDFKFEDDLSCVVNLSDIKSVHRADAEYFQPKYKRIIDKIKKLNAKMLIDIIENIPAKFNPISQSDKVFRYVELSNINSSIGIIDGYSEVLGKETPSRAKRILKKDDIIVSSVEGSLEKVALVDEEQDGFLASTGFFQFRSKEILPEVLLVLAKSPVLQMQLEKYCAGTILTAVPKEAIKNMLLPILTQSTQQKISDLACQSHEARRKAKELLEEAKKKVEEMILENNE